MISISVNHASRHFQWGCLLSVELELSKRPCQTKRNLKLGYETRGKISNLTPFLWIGIHIWIVGYLEELIRTRKTCVSTWPFPYSLACQIRPWKLGYVFLIYFPERFQSQAPECISYFKLMKTRQGSDYNSYIRKIFLRHAEFWTKVLALYLIDDLNEVWFTSWIKMGVVITKFSVVRC